MTSFISFKVVQLYTFTFLLELCFAQKTSEFQESKEGNNAIFKDIIKRIEVRTRLAVFTNRQCERDNGRLSVNSLAVIQIIRQAVFYCQKNDNPSCVDQQKHLLVVATGRGQGLKFFLTFALLFS